MGRTGVMNTNQPIEAMILTARGSKVILDADLAAIYGVPTKRLNEQVKRNAERFPIDFAFQLSTEEWVNLKSQFATSSSTKTGGRQAESNRSQIATGSQKHRDPRFLPWVFTEHGAIMAATVLNSLQAVSMSVYVVRAFIRMREQLAANAAILKRLTEIDKTLLHHDHALKVIWQKLQPLLQPLPGPEKKKIGFKRESE